MVFDLDPGEGADLLTCAQVALLLKKVLDGLSLRSWPKVSGSKGLQLYVPLNSGGTYAVTQPFAKALAELLAKQRPDEIVAEMAKSKRPNKVFIDWSQNADFKTTVGVYSLRAKRDRPFVSLPISWDELKSALKTRNTANLFFEPDAALERLAQIGDIFAPVLTLKQSLPATLKTLHEYERKRDFSKTAEPPAPIPRGSRRGNRKVNLPT